MFGCFGRAQVHQIVTFGLDGAGKTTLLYRLKIPSWKPDDIIKDLKHLKGKADVSKDPGYHYEEMSGAPLGAYGIWDVPGSEVMMRMWPTFYRYVKVSAVIFVVDGTDIDDKRLDTARRQLHFLLNEDELRVAAFYLIVNEWDPAKKENYTDAIYEMLGVSEIENSEPQKNRFKKTAFNISEIKPSDRNWTDILKEIHSVYISIGGGK